MQVREFAFHSSELPALTELKNSKRKKHVLYSWQPMFSGVFHLHDFIRRTGIHKPTAMGLLLQLTAAEVLRELRPGSSRRAAVLCFPESLNIAEGRRIV